MTLLILTALITLALTTLFSLAGVGAALILIPIFLAFGIELHTAMATALLLNALGMTVASATFIRKGLVEWRLVAPMLVLAVGLSPLGVWAAHGLDRTLLLWLFVVFLVFAAGMMLFYQPRPRSARASTAATLALGLPVGGAAGFIGGLLGVGGGNIIVPALVASGLEPKRAAASASFVVIFASLSGFLAHVQVAHIDPALLGVTAVATLAGAALGAWLATERLSGTQLKRAIALVLLAVAAKTAWSLL
ncbi:sulfite exporter TauE/SafE family protein [Caldichromatium japonicum]|uniref:Probable membrane transporter protein n=1 Tax=Caldichromatium japonicum TaxID=2699430 RepID=A0A6G7VB83_9GAMM|nr:sulfite exporter TauE/SafE family protein [Caldichromatium japonicum]QIK37135.1 sulfite exporter TauE/SafE family protein [Caldichromatium japonicum]